MNLGNIQQSNDDFYDISVVNTDKDAAYYSLLIGIRAYFTTYHNVAMNLRRFQKDDERRINDAAQENNNYIESYINIAIHIQHFFELEIKRILEDKHILFAVDSKGDPLIMYKLLHNKELQHEDTEKLKSIEFSDALSRLKKLVQNNIINDDVAKIFVAHEQLLKVINFLRNTTLHRGRRLMKYCSLDRLFAQNLLPFINEIMNQPYYALFKRSYDKSGIYEIIDKIILEGKKDALDYTQIALLKEIGRCKLKLESLPKLDETKDKDYIEKIIEKKMLYSGNDVVKIETKCPCCQYNTIFEGRELVGVDIEELGDEMGNGAGFRVIHIPDYEGYFECAWCGFKISTFVDIE